MRFGDRQGLRDRRASGASRVSRLARRLRAFLRDRRGAVNLLWAVAGTGMLGFGGLATDIGLWYMYKRDAQTAADAGAVAAAHRVRAGETAENVMAAARAASAQNGFPHGGEITVEVNSPPQSGSYPPGVTAIEVVVGRNYTPLLAGLFVGSPVTVRSRAVAALRITGGNEHCILSLGEIDVGLEVTGNTNLQLNCGIAVKSSGNPAFRAAGNVDLGATQICITGGAEVSGNVDFKDAEPEEGCPTPGDPLASAPEPEADSCSCDHTNFSLSSGDTSHVLHPGVYCGGIKVSGSGKDIFMNPGTYVLAGGGMDVGGSSNLIRGDDVMIYNTGNCQGGGHGDVKFTGGTLRLGGKQSGPYAGVLFFNQRNPDNKSDFEVTGNVTVDLDGVVYWPNAGTSVKYAGTASSTQDCGVNIIGHHIVFRGTADTVSTSPDCVHSNVSIGGVGEVRLIY